MDKQPVHEKKHYSSEDLHNLNDSQFAALTITLLKECANGSDDIEQDYNQLLVLGTELIDRWIALRATQDKQFSQETLKGLTWTSLTR